MKTKLLLLTLLLILFSQTVIAQTEMYNLLYKKGNSFILKKDYISAFEYFDKAKEETNNLSLKNKAQKQKEFCQQKIRQQSDDIIKQNTSLKEALEKVKKLEADNKALAMLSQKTSGKTPEDENNTYSDPNNSTVTTTTSIYESIDPQNINLAKILTPVTAKTINDFKIPEYMLKEDKELVDLIIRSESMNDGERQYWFDLTKTMNIEQVEKLRNILLKERKKLAEIEAKYGLSEDVKIGESFYNKGEYDNAFTSFLKAKEDYPNGASANTWIARIYAVKNDYDRAEDYILMIDGAKYISEGFSKIGNDFYEAKNYADALKSHLKAAEYDSKSTTAFFYSGFNFYLVGQPIKSKEYFNKAYLVAIENAEKDNENYSPYWNLSWYSLFANKPQEAITAARKSLELSPDKIGVNTNLVLGYVLNNEFDKAKQIYLKYKGEIYIDNKSNWNEIFLKDIENLEKVGITHKDFEKVKQLLNE